MNDRVNIYNHIMIYSIIIIVQIFIGCIESGHNQIDYGRSVKQSAEVTTEFAFVKRIQKFMDDLRGIKIDHETKFLPIKDQKYVLLQKQTIYELDSTFAVISSINMENIGCHIKGSIKSIAYNSPNLYYTDLSNHVNIINLDWHKFSMLEVSGRTEPCDNSSFVDIEILQNKKIVLTNVLVPDYGANIKKSGVTVGRIINEDGMIIEHLKVPCDKVDNVWMEVIDYPFCQVHKDKIYMSFVFSGKLYVFNSDGEYEKYTNLELSPEWSPAKKVLGPNDLRNKVINRNKIQFYNDFIYHLFFDASIPVFTIYDTNLTIIGKQKLLHTSISGVNYKFYINGQYLVMFGSELEVFRF